MINTLTSPAHNLIERTPYLEDLGPVPEGSRPPEDYFEDGTATESNEIRTSALQMQPAVSRPNPNMFSGYPQVKEIVSEPQKADFPSTYGLNVEELMDNEISEERVEQTRLAAKRIIRLHQNKPTDSHIVAPRALEEPGTLTSIAQVTAAMEAVVAITDDNNPLVVERHLEDPEADNLTLLDALLGTDKEGHVECTFYDEDALIIRRGLKAAHHRKLEGRQQSVREAEAALLAKDFGVVHDQEQKAA